MINNPISSSALDPLDEYTRRLEARRASLEDEQRRSRKIWILRRIVFGIICVAIVLAIDKMLPPWWIALPAAVFIALMAIHQRVHKRRSRLERAVKFYEKGLARIQDHWAGSGESG